MNILDNLKMAVFSIRTNKMRSLLTMLGIIIGISSVIMILGVGGGAKSYMIGSFEQVGAATVTLGVDSQNALESDYITFEDLEAIRQRVEHVKYISPNYGYWCSMEFKNSDHEAIVYGCGDSFNRFNGADMVTGRFFNEAEYLGGKNVVVIDEYAAKYFFGNTNVTGMSITVNLYGDRMRLKIVGVIGSADGNFYMEGQPFYLYMPITTLFNSLGADPTLQSVYLMADDPAYADSMGLMARNVLEMRHGNRGRDVYTLESLMQQVDMITDSLNMLTGFVGAVAAISLLVGGIGVMNIMLVAVTERTREIGIRKSLGARTNSILFQFLTESAIITLIGGAIGLLLGILGAYGISGLIGGMMGGSFSPEVTLANVLLALGFSCSVGIFFGLYPARKAARLAPIEALRHE